MKKIEVVFAAFVAVFAGCAQTTDTKPETEGKSVYNQVLNGEVDIETRHPYANHTNRTWEIQAPEGAQHVEVHLDRFETEPGYDFLDLYDSEGRLIHHLSGALTGRSYAVEGNYVRLHFTSDYSVKGWGFKITRYTYDVVQTNPTDHRPYCGAIGSRSEGWYWGDTEELIRWTQCADLSEPQCGALGSRSEGWYSDDGLIVWDNCHRTVGIALWGETCGPSEGMTCHEGMYCRTGEPGTCLNHGQCEADADCTNQNNMWLHPMCMGYASCNTAEKTCAWHCNAEPPQGPWSWTTVLLRDVESAHPYANDFDWTWTVTREGASKIKVHFLRIETEQGYDRLTLWGNVQEYATMLEGNHEDLWTEEFEGDTLQISLHTDSSVTRWGFRADAVSYYHQLPAGMCNRDEDCSANEYCNPHMCINPYAPCHGDCVPEAAGGDYVSSDTPLAIPDNDQGGIESGIQVSDLPADCELQVSVNVDIRHTWRGDLVVTLADPANNRVELHNRQGGSTDDLTLTSVPLTGQLGLEGGNGTWHLNVSDWARYDTGTLMDWSLHLSCR